MGWAWQHGRAVSIKVPTGVSVTKFDGNEWLYYFDQDEGGLRYGVSPVDMSQPLPDGNYALDGVALKVRQETGKIVLRIICEPPLPN